MRLSEEPRTRAYVEHFTHKNQSNEEYFRNRKCAIANEILELDLIDKNGVDSNHSVCFQVPEDLVTSFDFGRGGEFRFRESRLPLHLASGRKHRRRARLIQTFGVNQLQLMAIGPPNV